VKASEVVPRRSRSTATVAIKAPLLFVTLATV
jgi:hypothetical protein